MEKVKFVHKFSPTEILLKVFDDYIETVDIGKIIKMVSLKNTKLQKYFLVKKQD